MHSRNFEALTNDPPLKSPYFTLPDICHLTELASTTKKKQKSIVELWGHVAKMSEEHTTDFLLELLKHSEWHPDFQAVATKWNLSSWKTVQARLKSVVESRKYKLDEDLKISGGVGPPEPDPVVPKQRRKKRSADSSDGGLTPAASTALKASLFKKRKVDDKSEEDNCSKDSKKTGETIREDSKDDTTLPEVEVETAIRTPKKRAKPLKSDTKHMKPTDMCVDDPLVRAKKMKRKKTGRADVEGMVESDAGVETG